MAPSSPYSSFLSSMSADSSSSATSTPAAATTNIPSEDFDIDLNDGRASAILAVAGCGFTLVVTIIVLKSGLAFASVRRCACNIVLLYVAFVQVFGSLNLAASALYVGATGVPIPNGLPCTINGGVAQVTFASHSGMALFYVSIVLMYKYGNRKARRIMYLLLALNTLLFIGLSVAGALTGEGYVAKEKRMYCWIENYHGLFDHSYFRRFVLLYLWAFLPIFFGLACIIYLLLRTWHMRAQTRKPWQMIRARLLYSLFSALFWAAFFFVRYFPDKPGDNKHPEAVIWGKRVSDFLQASCGGWQMLIFIFMESIYRRWSVRKRGPSEERLHEIRSEILLNIRQGEIQLSNPKIGVSVPSITIDTRSHGTFSGNHHTNNESLSSHAPPSRNFSYAQTATTNGSMAAATYTAEQQAEIEQIVQEFVSMEQEDPFVQQQLSQILDEMGPGAKPKVGGQSVNETLLPGHSVQSRISRTSRRGLSPNSSFQQQARGGGHLSESTLQSRGGFKPQDLDSEGSSQVDDEEDASSGFMSSGKYLSPNLTSTGSSKRENKFSSQRSYGGTSLRDNSTAAISGGGPKILRNNLRLSSQSLSADPTPKNY